ncbi:hypothetical protein SFC15_12915 [Shouchella clausii]
MGTVGGFIEGKFDSSSRKSINKIMKRKPFSSKIEILQFTETHGQYSLEKMCEKSGVLRDASEVEEVTSACQIL